MENVSIVVAMARNYVIGSGNKLPWHLPVDLRHFQKLTDGHTVIMGRKTYESICDKLGGPLPGRVNIVVSKTMNICAKECVVVRSLEEAFELTSNQDEVFVIGGQQMYELALPFANRIYMTLINKNFPGDAFFPIFDALKWRPIDLRVPPIGGSDEPSCTFIILERGG